jgi:hypothetical protein
MNLLLVGLSHIGIHYAQIKDIDWCGEIFASRRGWLVRRIGGQQQNRERIGQSHYGSMSSSIKLHSGKVEKSGKRSTDIRHPVMQ